MARIRIRETGEVVTETTFRTRNKKARPVLTAGISKERLDQLGADPVLNGAPAEPTAPYEYSYESGVAKGDDGVWYTVNSVGPVFTEYTDDDGNVQTVDAQTATYRAHVDADAAASARFTRTTLLDESDWTQVNDSPLSNELKTTWATYREGLRNLPNASGWPHTHTLPEKPE